MSLKEPGHDWIPNSYSITSPINLAERASKEATEKQEDSIMEAKSQNNATAHTKGGLCSKEDKVGKSLQA